MGELLHRVMDFFFSRGHGTPAIKLVLSAVRIFRSLTTITVTRAPEEGGGVLPKKNLVAVCGPRPKTLTLFMTEICDFPYPIHDLTKNSIAGL